MLGFSEGKRLAEEGMPVKSGKRREKESTSGKNSVTRRKFLVRTAQVAALYGMSAAARVAAAPAVRGETSITYWTFLNPKTQGPREAAMRQVHEAFTKAYPNIDLNIEVMPYGVNDQQLLKAAASGKGPDVMRTHVEALDVHVNAGSILPLDEWTSGWSDKQRQDFLLPWNWTVRNGKKYAIPLEFRVHPLVYRKDLLEKTGLELPKTWGELAKCSASLASDKLAGFAVGMAAKDRGANLMQWLFSAYASAGGEVVGKEGKARFNDDVGVKVFQFLADLVEKFKSPKDSVNWGPDEVMMGIKGGTLAMTVMGSHRVGTARMGRGVGSNLQTAPVPHASDPNKRSPTYVYGWTHAVCATSRNKNAAWKFVEFWSKTENQVINARVGGEMPAVASAYNDPWFKTPEAEEMARWKSWMVKDPIIFSPYPRNYPDLGDLLARAASDIVGSRKPIKAVLDDAASRYNSL